MQSGLVSLHPVHGPVCLLEDSQLHVIISGGGMMVAYDLAYLDDLVIGKADTSKELFVNWRSVLLLCFSVVVPE